MLIPKSKLLASQEIGPDHPGKQSVLLTRNCLYLFSTELETWPTRGRWKSVYTETRNVSPRGKPILKGWQTAPAGFSLHQFWQGDAQVSETLQSQANKMVGHQSLGCPLNTRNGRSRGKRTRCTLICMQCRVLAPEPAHLSESEGSGPGVHCHGRKCWEDVDPGSIPDRNFPCQ